VSNVSNNYKNTQFVNTHTNLKTLSDQKVSSKDNVSLKIQTQIMECNTYGTTHSTHDNENNKHRFVTVIKSPNQGSITKPNVTNSLDSNNSFKFNNIDFMNSINLDSGSKQSKDSNTLNENKHNEDSTIQVESNLKLRRLNE